MAAVRGISHCYQRPTYEDWPYSVFTMAHGRSKEECDAILDSIADEHGLHGDDRATLYSSTEFKKIRLHYFTRRLRRVGSPQRARWRDAVGHRAPSEALYARARGPDARRRQLARCGRCARSARDPIFIERGEGCELIDVDGNRYVDWVCSWGPLILGHADPAVVAAVARGGGARHQLRRRRPRARSSSPRRSPTASARSRWCGWLSSGTEATMSAVRLARAATGREAIVKFAGAYHGHVDGLLAEAGSGLATRRHPRQPGRHRGAGGGHGGRALERPRGASRPRSPSTRSPRSWPSRSPANMGVVPPRRRLPRAPARARRRGRRAARSSTR